MNSIYELRDAIKNAEVITEDLYKKLVSIYGTEKVNSFIETEMNKYENVDDIDDNILKKYSYYVDLITDNSVIEKNSEKKIEEKKDEDVFCEDIVKQYLYEIGQISLLTPAEEKRMAVKIKELNFEINNVLEIKSMLLNDENYSENDITIIDESLAKLYKEKKVITDKFYEANLKLVVHVAKRFNKIQLPFMDLIQEGNLGLMRALDSYDVDRGNKFSTYATWWIRQYITRAIADTGSMIRKPVHFVEKYNIIERFKKKCIVENGIEPTIEDIAIGLGITVEECYQILKDTEMSKVISSDLCVGTGENDRDIAIIDFIEDDGPLPEDVAYQKALEESVEEAFSCLNQREKEVIKYRLGFYGNGKCYTLEEVGQILGVTRERIRQIEAKSIRKLKFPARASKLRDYYFNK